MDGLASELAAIVGDRWLKKGDAARDRDPGGDPANNRGAFWVQPATTAETSAVVIACTRYGATIVPQGGLTGLVGGAAMTAQQVAISTRRMNRIEELDPISGFAVAGAGATIQDLQQAAAVHDLHPGLDLPSRGSATVGGTISTNAGGLEAFRQGVMRQRVLGLEVVLPDGRVLSDMTRVTKVSAGYDLKQVFIGAEGTLGIVCRAVIRLDRLARRGPVMLLGLRDGDALLMALQAARATGRLLAAEAMWGRYLRAMAQAHDWSSPGFGGGCDVNLLICLESAPDAQDIALDLFGALESDGAATEGLLAQSEAQAAAIWALREDSEALYRAFPASPSYDVSVPIAQVPGYVADIRRSLGEMGFDPFIFGHIGDGNLHISIDRAAAEVSADELRRIETILYDPLPGMRGSFSAEHGIGLRRAQMLPRYADPVKLSLMRDLKAMLDPAGRMNPGKVLATGG